MQGLEESQCNLEVRRRNCHTAGMKDIKTLLEETDRRLVACQAGQPYVRHAKQCQQRKAIAKRLEEEARNVGHAMVLQQLSGEELNLTGGLGDTRRRTISRGDQLFIKSNDHLKLSYQIEW